MPKFRLSRRAVLRGAGSVAIALPWLEIMGSDRQARAAAAPARRFLAVYTPGGTILERWRPTGTESSFALSPILAPLESVKDRILILDGLDMKSAIGEQSQAGMIAWLTGTPQQSVPGQRTAGGPSIDQVLATEILRPRAHASLSLAVRWGTGKGHGVPSAVNVVNYANAPGFAPIAPAIDPVATWRELFGVPNPAATWDESILDFVDRRYAKLATRLGSMDRLKLEAHLENIRTLEKELASASRCRPPALVDTSDYDPASGLNSRDDGSLVDEPTDAAIPKVGKLFTDMMVMALACDLTAVGTLQWADSEAKHTLPWLDLRQTHYYYQNGGGFHPEELTTIYSWYSAQHEYLLTEMAKVDMGGHSLLDESVVFFGSEVQHPATHSKIDMPFLLAGGGGGLRTGRWLRYDDQSHNDLLVSILRLFGDTRTSFGNPMYSTEPLTNLI